MVHPIIPIPSIHLIADDDASTSSTFKVNNDVKIISPLHGSTTSNITCKSVRFAEKCDDEYHDSPYTIDEIKKTWYKTKDYKMFRTTTLESSKQIIATEKRNRAPYSYQRVMERTYDVCQTASTEQQFNILAKSEMVHLQRWLEVASGRVGLEKWCIRTISNDKSARRKAIIDVVMNVQADMEELLLLGNDDDAQEEQDQYDAEELIRDSCERLSRPSRYFAQTIAQALATVVNKENFFQ